MKGMSILTVSFRCVNYTFCSHFGCTGYANIFSCHGIFYGHAQRNEKMSCCFGGLSLLMSLKTVIK